MRNLRFQELIYVESTITETKMRDRTKKTTFLFAQNITLRYLAFASLRKLLIGQSQNDQDFYTWPRNRHSTSHIYQIFCKTYLPDISLTDAYMVRTSIDDGDPAQLFHVRNVSAVHG